MKLSNIINYPLGLLGLKLARVSAIRKMKEQLQFKETNGLGVISDIESDVHFMEVFKKIKDLTIVGIERCYSLYQSLNYIIRNDIKGDLVECGVWKAGSAMLMAYILIEARQSERKIFLYDTFEGMTEPGIMDGEKEKIEWERLKSPGGGSDWCYSPLDDVKKNLQSTGYPEQNIEYIMGKVEDTIPGRVPRSIALLRLDTDWYESTRHELIHLFPLLEKKGVLIIDDYGSWPGARKAVDEYFSNHKEIFMQRIDFTGRLIIK